MIAPNTPCKTTTILLTSMMVIFIAALYISASQRWVFEDFRFG